MVKKRWNIQGTGSSSRFVAFDKRNTPHQRTFLVLIVIILVLGTLNFTKARGQLIPGQDLPLVVDNTVYLDALSLEQKISQMVVVHGGLHNLEIWKKMQLGGIHLFALENGELYKEIIQKFQQGMTIPFFVTVDLEGCWNPFGNFITFGAVSEIDTLEEAFEKGVEEGKFLAELGFTINYAPVVDLDDEIWKCRSFPGNEENISRLAEAYISGLQSQNVLATAKHYPGKTLVVKDPHKHLVVASIDDKDVYPYLYLLEEGNVASIMTSHLITSGRVNSNGIPSVASESVVKEIKKDFSGLMVSDEVNMLGLKDFYPTLEEMYVAVFKAGNDLVLNFNEDPNEIYRMIKVVKEAVEEGIIPQEQVDNSVRKILTSKGFVVE